MSWSTIVFWITNNSEPLVLVSLGLYVKVVSCEELRKTMGKYHAANKNILDSKFLSILKTYLLLWIPLWVFAFVFFEQELTWPSVHFLKFSISTKDKIIWHEESLVHFWWLGIETSQTPQNSENRIRKLDLISAASWFLWLPKINS